VFEKSSFAGKTVLITGATGHLGREISRAFAGLGSNLILVDLYPDSLQELSSDLSEVFGVAVSVYACNFSDPEARKKVIDAVSADFDAIDVLINNAAFVGTSDLSGWSVPFDKQLSSVWPQVFEVNLTSVFEFAQGLSGNLRKSGSGAIVNIASIHAHVGPDWGLYEGTEMASPAAYAASKAGMVNLTKWLSTTMAPQVRVNSVSPGGIFRGQPTAFVEKYIARTPMGRMAIESDVVGAVLFFSSDSSAYITGQDLCVDGGYSVW
jgi:NAD(P)-dependent dehydrogenase (short-subunit alcohol dehydrogenase family)